MAFTIILQSNSVIGLKNLSPMKEPATNTNSMVFQLIDEWK